VVAGTITSKRAGAAPMASGAGHDGTSRADADMALSQHSMAAIAARAATGPLLLNGILVMRPPETCARRFLQTPAILYSDPVHSQAPADA
jgi:hypothetical protein